MTELVVVSAKDEAALIAEMKRIVGFVDRVGGARLEDVAATCAAVRGECAISVIARDVVELRMRLASAISRLEGGAARIRDKSGTYYFKKHLLGAGGGKLAFVYPGVVSFYPDMLRELAIEYRECRDAFDELEEAMKDNEEFSPSSFVFPPASYYRHDADIFSSGAYAQALVATYAGCAGLSRLLKSSGLEPDGVFGLAGGDLAAVMASGEALDRPSRVKTIREIYRTVYKAVNHGGLPWAAMLSVISRRPGEIEAALAKLPADRIMTALDVSPRQRTLAVDLDFADAAIEALSREGLRVIRLALDKPFNTPLCKELVPAIRKFAAECIKTKPVCDVYSCVSAEPIKGTVKALREDAAERWARPVRFREVVRRMYDDGYRVFLEVGPRGLMTAAIGDTLKGEDFAAIALNSIHRGGILQLQHAVGQLVASGALLDVPGIFPRPRARMLDFDASALGYERRDSEMKLSRAFPKLTLLSGENMPNGASLLGETKGRGAKAACRAAAIARQAQRERQFDFGAINPLVSDADVLESTPGIGVEIAKTFRLSEYPFLGDSALGTSQMSYSDPNLKGLILLTIPVGCEIMAETAEMVVPNRKLRRIEDFNCRRLVSFDRGELKVFVRAERVAASAVDEIAVKVQLRDDSPNSAYTWPVMEATFVLAESLPLARPIAIEPLSKPRNVHWSGRDVYPSRLCHGKRLRGINFVAAWSESGIDYELTVPPLVGNVAFTRFPIWVVNPLLMEIVVSGFALWRSHEKFAGAFSFPFRMRRLSFGGTMPREGERLKAYLRLTGVTPRSQLCDIVVTDGNGKELAAIAGWEELSDRVPGVYRELIMQPAMTFVTSQVDSALLGEPATEFSSAFVADVPYAIFERNEEVWLKMLSRIVLGGAERKDFAEMTGSTSRRTEWLFGRIAAKEAVRRFLKEQYQARWSDADIQIWADDSGKPHALGEWSENLPGKLDIAISHTAQFVVALVAANARVGVDVESVTRDLSEEFTAGVFAPEELELAAQAANASQAIVKFWCAKEAVSKALGTGIRYSPKEMNVTSYRAEAGTLTIRLDGAWVEAFKNFKGRDIPVAVRIVRDHALASVFIPSSLFADEN